MPRVAAADFHVSAIAKKDESVEATAPPPSEGFWKAEYSLPLGIALAVPALKYEWYLVNEETQLAACMMAFSLIVYKQFGSVIYEALEEDGKRILEEHNTVEDADIAVLKHKIADVEGQSMVLQDAQDIKQLKIETYEKLNTAGKVKPLYDFKSQMEKILATMQAEETNMKEKAKQALMAEATAAVQKAFTTNKDLGKACLASAIAQLEGKPSGSDPVKDAYVKFFQAKAKAGGDEAAEAKAAREQMVTKLNAVARSDGFFFEFDASGKPKMVV